MTEKTAKAAQDIIDMARSAKSFIAAAGEESLPDESLMRAAVTFNMLQRRGMITAVVRNDDTMCKPHDFDDMYRAHAIALIARNFTDHPPNKAAPVQVETQPECPVHPRDRPVVPEALDAATRAERDRVLALAGQMLHQCAGWHSTMGRRLEALIEDIKCGARTYP